MNDSPAASPLTHDAAFHEVGALALGALPREEERLVRAHVENCPLCSAELAAMSSVVGAMPTRPPGGGMDQRVSEGIRSRLLARAADRSTRRQSVGNVYRLLAIAAVLAAILLGVGYYRERAERRDLLASAARRDSVISALNSLVRDRDAELSDHGSGSERGGAIIDRHSPANGANVLGSRHQQVDVVRSWSVGTEAGTNLRVMAGDGRQENSGGDVHASGRWIRGGSRDLRAVADGIESDRHHR